MDALANPSLQRGLSIAFAVAAATGVLAFVALWLSARRPIAPAARVFRLRAAIVALFVAGAAGTAFALWEVPVDPGTRGAQGSTLAEPTGPVGEEIASATRISTARLPALSLDASPGWRLELDPAGGKATATSDQARLVVSTAILREAVDADALLRQLADGQRALGLRVGDPFDDRLGDLPAKGFLASDAGHSACVWMVRRDAHLASSAICTADGKPSAREACRAPLASLRWRAPAPIPAHGVR